MTIHLGSGKELEKLGERRVRSRHPNQLMRGKGLENEEGIVDGEIVDDTPPSHEKSRETHWFWRLSMKLGRWLWAFICVTFQFVWKVVKKIGRSLSQRLRFDWQMAGVVLVCLVVGLVVARYVVFETDVTSKATGMITEATDSLQSIPGHITAWFDDDGTSPSATSIPNLDIITTADLIRSGVAVVNITGPEEFVVDAGDTPEIVYRLPAGRRVSYHSVMASADLWIVTQSGNYPRGTSNPKEPIPGSIKELAFQSLSGVTEQVLVRVY